jgi:hypothetical protein
LSTTPFQSIRVTSDLLAPAEPARRRSSRAHTKIGVPKTILDTSPTFESRANVNEVIMYPLSCQRGGEGTIDKRANDTSNSPRATRDRSQTPESHRVLCKDRIETLMSGSSCCIGTRSSLADVLHRPQSENERATSWHQPYTCRRRSRANTQIRVPNTILDTSPTFESRANVDEVTMYPISC